MKINQDKAQSFSRECEVELIQYMGSDAMVVNAARVSHRKHARYVFHDGELGEKELGLIDFMASNDPMHWTPFSHCAVTFMVTIPIFVANQLKRHRIGQVGHDFMSINEVSRRYVDDAPEFPRMTWRARPEKLIKQGSGALLSKNLSSIAEKVYEDACVFTERSYKTLLDLGVAPEQARSVLPMATMTSYYLTGSLYYFANVCKHRLDSHAQGEIQSVARRVDEEVRDLFPTAWLALRTHMNF